MSDETKTPKPAVPAAKHIAVVFIKDVDTHRRGCCQHLPADIATKLLKANKARKANDQDLAIAGFGLH